MSKILKETEKLYYYFKHYNILIYMEIWKNFTLLKKNCCDCSFYNYKKLHAILEILLFSIVTTKL